MTDSLSMKAPPAWWKRVLRSGALLAGIYLACGLATVMFLEDSFIYFPEKGGVGKSPGEDVTLTTSDGVRVHGWYVTNPAAKMTLLWFHGNAGNLEHRRDMLRELRELPANVLAIDYRGYGKSEGKPSEAGLYLDARAAYDWLRARTAAENIVLLGKSIGAAPACELATRVPCAGLAVQSAFTSTPDLASRVLPLFPARLFMKTKYDNLAKIGRIACPKLFIHSRGDEIIPFEMGERLYAAAAPPKEHLWVDGAGHNELWITHSREYYRRLAEFLARCGK